MKYSSSLLIVLAALLLSSRVEGADGGAEEKAVKAVLDAYAAACEKSDFRLLSSLFAHDADIVLINVGGDARGVAGWPAVGELYKSLFSVSGDVEMRHRDISIKMLAAGSVACVACSQDVKWTIQGTRSGYEGVRTTCLLEKREGQWKIVHCHWSLPTPAEGDGN